MTPRLAFVGLGWIGRMRLKALVESGAARPACYVDPSDEAVAQAQQIHAAPRAASLEDAWEHDPQGLVIATPNSHHVDAALAALERGLPVFCQKPLATRAADAQRVVEAAARADRLLEVDWSYRHARSLARVRTGLREGAIGDVYHVDLQFHNAYGPDRPWFYDLGLSGGGCFLDLGGHLLDTLFWSLEDARVESVWGRFWQRGRRWRPGDAGVEDHAVAFLDLDNAATARLACSWRMNAGLPCVIDWTFHGTRGALRVRNVNGSFYDFIAERLDGTQAQVLEEPPDPWGGRSLVAWARRIPAEGFDPAAWSQVRLAQAMEEVYAA